jgi:hypothetical protein
MPEEISKLESKLLGTETKIRREITCLKTKKKHRFNAVDKRFDRIEKTNERRLKRLVRIFQTGWNIFEEMRNDLSKRIKKLEDNQRTCTKIKNELIY